MKMSHSATTCPICLASRPSREASPQALSEHFEEHGFCPTVKNPTPSIWVWSWLRSDPQVWAVATAPRQIIEMRLKQIEALSCVNDIIQDPLACLILDLGWRNWEEGLPRVVSLRFSQDWILGDELPEPKIVEQVASLLNAATPSEGLGLSSALYNRLAHAVPPSRSEDWYEPLQQAWSWIPVQEENGQWVFSGNTETRRYQIAVWRLKAEKIIPNAMRFLNEDHRQSLLPWWASVVSPPLSIPHEHQHAQSQNQGTSAAFKIEKWLDLKQDPLWPDRDPHLPWLYERFNNNHEQNPKELMMLMEHSLLHQTFSVSAKRNSIYRL